MQSGNLASGPSKKVSVTLTGPVKKISDLDRLREDDLVDFLKDRGVPIAGLKSHQLLRLAKSEFRFGIEYLDLEGILGAVQ